MAMNEGSVTIDPNTGAATPVGCAGEVFTALDATVDYGGLSGPQLATAKQKVADMAEAVAKVIPHIVANAQVSTTINAGVVAPAVQPGTGSSGNIVGGTTGTVS